MAQTDRIEVTLALLVKIIKEIKTRKNHWFHPAFVSPPPYVTH
jgi:hypothetical protein